MATNNRISEPVLRLLTQCKAEGKHISLPKAKMQPQEYATIKAAFTSMRGKWHGAGTDENGIPKGRFAFDEAVDTKAFLQGLILSGEMPSKNPKTVIEKGSFAVPNNLTSWAFGVLDTGNDYGIYNGYLGLLNIEKSPFRPAKVLHLTLKRKWFDMILRGKKKEEYRDIKNHWFVRLVDKQGEFKPFEVVRFSLGYAADGSKIDVECLGIRLGEPNPEWSEPNAAYCYIIKLGRILNVHFIDKLNKE